MLLFKCSSVMKRKGDVVSTADDTVCCLPMCVFTVSTVEELLVRIWPLRVRAPKVSDGIKLCLK